MPMPLPSFLFKESTEPPDFALPLEARRIHFCTHPRLEDGPKSDGVETSRVVWTVSNEGWPGEIVNQEYAYRHDLIEGGHLARTSDEKKVDELVQRVVEKEKALERW